jgi:hypothetical protein
LGVKLKETYMDLSILGNKSVQLSAVLSAGNFFYAYHDQLTNNLFVQQETENAKHSIANLFEKIKADQDEYGFKVSGARFSICNGLMVLVPKTIFHEDRLQSYLKNFYSPAILSNSVIKQDPISAVEAVGVYLIPKVWQKHFDKLEPKPLIRHSLNALIQYSLSQISNPDFVLAMFEDNQIQIVVIKNGQLVLANVYSCENGDAFLYFLNLSFELHGLSRAHDPIFIGGEITEGSELYDLIFRYFRYVHFTAEDMNYVLHQEEPIPHMFLNLHTLNLCE